MKAVRKQRGGVFFLHGYGGTGKTFMWRTLASSLRSQSEIVLTVASSGIASLLLPGGRTAHSKFKIPVPTLDNSTCEIEHDDDRDNLRLKNTENSDEVKKNSDWLLKVGEGKLSEPNDGYADIHIPKELLISDYADPIAAIVHSTYPNLISHYKSSKFLQERAILASTIEVVDQINNYVFNLIPGEAHDYYSCDSMDRSDVNDCDIFETLTPQFLNSLRTSGLPNHKITLKVGTPIMIMRNLDPAEGLCNGTRLIVTKLANHVIEAKIISGKNIGE
ncbi:ATP-dependent DNA helicase pif1 [Trifolium repens]|nr:ATP-dependent DNA helicase pif1 [Trifolium repens]